ncbi:MAG: hypothetical protein IJZ84_02455 [Lachnospiraceae bacterium]|nr:hypothetical protein [Lachnospiraceae bacterium]
MNKNKKLWVGIISLTLALLLFAILLIVKKSLEEEQECATVFRAKSDMMENMLLTKDNFDQYVEEQAVPVDWIPKGYVTGQQQIYNTVLNTDITEGSILTEANLTAYTEVYKGYKQLSWIGVPIKELYEGVAGSLRAGDYIDIYSICQAEQQYQCSLLAERVRIEAAYDNQGTIISESSSNGLTQLIVIPMEKEQVAIFYEDLARGNIRVAKYEE